MPTALVTGGNRGIGRAAVVALAARGFSVAFVDLEDDEETEGTLRAAEAAGGRAVFIRGDIADLASHERIVQGALAIDGSLAALVNNAGVAAQARTDLLEVPAGDFDRVLSVNLRGTFFLTQTAARHMLTDPSNGRRRCIVTVSSISAVAASPDRAAYCCSKAALSMVVQLFAARLAPHGIACYEVRPGIIRTDMTRPVAGRYDRLIDEGTVPIARWGEPDDVGRVVATLCAADLSYVTGEVLHVDGGLHIARL